jgi:hypothetical protein
MASADLVQTNGLFDVPWAQATRAYAGAPDPNIGLANIGIDKSPFIYDYSNWPIQAIYVHSLARAA